mmetsp:Transcript_24909/g.61732  ORF Transcript_24909/g.61732 Transcript_24909/m.61732 type:complete len:229 (+) Transcript_24909:925-1611(+)
MPRNPQRSPRPSVPECVFSTEIDPSLRRKRDIESLRCWKPFSSSGKSPAKTIGCGLRKPGRAGCGFEACDSVSPTLASWMVFIPRLTQPTCPGPKLGSAAGISGRISSIVCTVYLEPVAADTSSIPLSSLPSSTSTRQSTPRKSSYHASKSSSRRGALAHAAGGGILLRIAGNSASTPSPVFAEMRSASSRSMSNAVAICSSVPSMSACPRSTLLTTGTMPRSCSNAR